MMVEPLTEDVLKEIFVQYIVPRLKRDRAAENPTLYMVAAQPGAGKTREIARIRQQHRNAVVIMGDDFRNLHPIYDDLMEHDPLSMPDVTAQATGRWVEMSIEWLRQNRRSVIIETTMRHPAATERTLEGFVRAGYRCEVTVMATPPQLSSMGTLMRYIGQMEQQGAGRWVNPAAHDEAVAQLPATLSGQIEKGNVNAVSIVTRTGKHLLDIQVDPQHRKAAIAQASEALKEGQNFANIAPVQRRQWDSDVRAVEAFINTGPDRENVKKLLDSIRNLDEDN